MPDAERGAAGLEARMNSMSLAGDSNHQRDQQGAHALVNTTWLAAQQQRKATQPFQPRPLKLFAKPEAGARAPLASRPTQQGDIERRVSRTPSTASLKAPTVPKSRDTAPTLDLGRYDGGFERDERRGRREAVNSEELAMASSMEGWVHAASVA